MKLARRGVVENGRSLVPCGLGKRGLSFYQGQRLYATRMDSKKLLYASHCGREKLVCRAAVSIDLPRVGLGTGPNKKLENDILEALSSVKGRGKSGLSPEAREKLEIAVKKLEQGGAGVREPASSELLSGTWRLLFTGSDDTASPIQRTFTGVDGFSVFQEISLDGEEVRVNNIVDFGKQVGRLVVEAAGSTDAKPLPGFTPRAGKGLPFGILGVSSAEPPSKPNMRVDFQFDTAAFYFKFLPITIPYPVPFRLLGDERKGWLDITYLSKDGTFRLSRGNKGTLFILVREETPQQKLIQSAIADRSQEEQIGMLVDTVVSSGTGIKNPANSSTIIGGWKLIWTKQGSDANPLQQRLAKVVQNWQIIGTDGTTLKNRVDLLPGVRVVAEAACSPDGPKRTNVTISKVLFQLGPFKFTLPVETDRIGYVDWLYVDDTLRITKGNRGSVFVHVRDRNVS